MTLQEQTDNFKYILNLEGHTAAFRLAYELSSNSVVLLAGSEWKLWYSNLLKPYVHYVPVKKDLSDLCNIIDWCRRNDQKCLQIIKNANEFYDKYLGVEGILDYLQMIFVNISKSIGQYQWLENPYLVTLDAEKAMIPIAVTYDDEYRYETDRTYPRCIGKLIANKSAFQRSKNLTNEGVLFSNEITTITRFSTINRIHLIKKISKKEHEHQHELYIGLNAVNKLVSSCVNFTYTYGRHYSDDKAFFLEYHRGQSFDKWLESNSYNEMTMLNIMIMINLAIASAQSQCGFIHYNLNPSNIILTELNKIQSFDYNLGMDKPVRCTTKIVPMIIDYGKSRAVVYECGNGILDKGIVNMYKNHSQAVDMLPLLYTVLGILKKNKNKNMARLHSFLVENELPHDTRDIEMMSEYGAVIDYTNANVDTLSTLTSMTFVIFFKRFFSSTIVKRIDDGTFNFSMNRGSSFIEELKMKYGFTNNAQKDEVITNAILRLDRQTFPRSENKKMRSIIQLCLNRHIKDIDDHVSKCSNPILKEKYRLLRSMIMDFDYRTTTDGIDTSSLPPWNLPAIDFDISITPDELLSLKQKCNKDYRDKNWLDILSMCVEAWLCDPKEYKILTGYQNGNMFKYINSLAIRNTCLWLSEKNAAVVDDSAVAMDER